MEPQCVGFEHAQVNANYLYCYTLAFPQESITFFAESNHLELMQDAFDAVGEFHQFKKRSIKFCVSGRLRKICNDFYNIHLAFKLAKHHQDSVCLLSATTVQLLILKVLNRIYRINIFIVMHGVLNAVDSAPNGILRRIFWVRTALNFFNSKYIYYLLNSKYIEKNMVEVLPKIKNYLRTSELPWFFDEPKGSHKTISGGPIVMMAGTAALAKGSEKFFTLAEFFSVEYPHLECKFFLAGHIVDEKLKFYVNNFVTMPSQNEPVADGLYRELIEGASFLTFFYPKTTYRFAISGVLFDAINGEIPIIALRNSCFEFYFEKYGALGWLCDSYEDIKLTLLREILNPDRKKLNEIKNNFSKFKADYSRENQIKRMQMAFKLA